MKVIVEADGGSRGDPGPAGYGAVVRDAAGHVLVEQMSGRFEWVPRARNSTADGLANRAMDEQ